MLTPLHATDYMLIFWVCLSDWAEAAYWCPNTHPEDLVITDSVPINNLEVKVKWNKAVSMDLTFLPSLTWTRRCIWF